MTPEDRLARLAVIADELDALSTRQEALFAERVGLWREGREAGQTTAALAGPSRVRPVTVSYLTNKAS